MKHYTMGKKLFAAVLHQMFMILMACSLFAMDDMTVRDRTGGVLLPSLFSVIGLVGTFVALAYLTNVSGYRNKEEKEVALHPIDRIYGDLLVAAFVVLMWLFFGYVMRLKGGTFEFAGLMVAVGALVYLFDIVFLCFYLSIVRRSKANILFSGMLIVRVIERVSAAAKDRGKKRPVTRKGREQKKIREALEEIAAGKLDTVLDPQTFHGVERTMAEAVGNIANGMSEALADSVKNERMKADLITNVSHDIKTPLTSIVSYVDLLKREEIENDNARKYIRILDEKSQRLKQLTEDLVEASRISSGNISLDMQQIDFVELLYQTGGEFNERFEKRGLTIITKLPHDAVMIRADGRQLYRAIENLYTNAAKYALEGTRVYVELSAGGDRAVFTMKNISQTSYEGELANGALAERFVRGESSRTTEGSGLGLSIAKNLTELMGGTFLLKVDGDMFVTEIAFPLQKQ